MGNNEKSIEFVMSFADRFSASVAAEMLESHGIRTMLTGMTSANYVYPSGVQLYVGPSDYERAVELLKEHGDY